MKKSYSPSELFTHSDNIELLGRLTEALSAGPLALRVTHVATSGMSRHIQVLGIWHGRIHDFSREVARLTGNRWVPEKGVHISGCGMDMGYALMEGLGWAWAKEVAGGSYAESCKLPNNDLSGSPIFPTNSAKRYWEWL